MHYSVPQQLCLCPGVLPAQLPVVLVHRPAGGEGRGWRRRWRGDRKERVKEGEKRGEVGGEVEDERHKSAVTECTPHPTLAASGSVVCTAALCRALTGGSAWV